jgi:hypothetical protein
MSQINNFCETPGKACTFGYCDENGCQDRRRILTPFGLSLLSDRDLIEHGDGVTVGGEEWADYVAELTNRDLL